MRWLHLWSHDKVIIGCLIKGASRMSPMITTVLPQAGPTRMWYLRRPLSFLLPEIEAEGGCCSENYRDNYPTKVSLSLLLSLRFQLLSSSRPEAELKTQLYPWASFRLLFDIEHQIQKDFPIFCWEETRCSKKVVLLLYSLKPLKLVRPQLWCMHPRIENEKQTEVFSRTNSKPWEVIVAFLLFSRNWREEESTECNVIQ